jgi:hypothetical protein
MLNMVTVPATGTARNLPSGDTLMPNAQSGRETAEPTSVSAPVLELIRKVEIVDAELGKAGTTAYRNWLSGVSAREMP